MAGHEIGMWYDAAGAPHEGAGKPHWWQLIWRWRKRGESVSNLVVLLALAGVAVFAWLAGPVVAPVFGARQAPQAELPKGVCSASTPMPRGGPLKVSDASGTAATLSVFVDRKGGAQTRQASQLAIQNGTLKPGTPLCMGASDLVSSNGETIAASQVASWAVVDNDGEHVTVFVAVSPRFGLVSGFGGYTGTVSLNDPRALGAVVPVDIHVEYPYLDVVIAFAMAAAFGGFVWGRLVHNGTKGSQPAFQPFWVNLILRIAVILVTAVPVISSQVLSNPDWTGSLAQYISVATLAGAAAIAATPTLSALVDRVQGAAMAHNDAGTNAAGHHVAGPNAGGPNG